MSRLPADAAARARIVTDLDTTLFVEAGAGSGKTSSLVGRFVSLVLAGADVAGIAAITFTEAAAAELRARVRETLEDVIAGREVLGLDPDERGVALARGALEQLDRAAISTLHAFAQRLLLASPIEAGLPPRVEVHDEISSALRTEDRWAAFVRRLVDDDALAVPLTAALALDIGMHHLAAVAATCNQNWDLLVDLDLTAERALMLDEASLLVSVAPIIEAAHEIEALAEVCVDESDLLKRWIGDTMWPALEPLRAAAGDPYALLQATADPPKITRYGKGPNWPDGTKARINALWNDAREALTAHRASIADQVVRRLSVEVVEFTLREAALRRREGRLEFHDLLVLARQVLRDDRVVRQRMHDRYRYLLIDEFQDTDPIQVELAVRIAADPDHDTSCPWDEVDVDAGRLFFVGDPKQSIYRFRRADIDLFVRTSERNPSGATRLDTNFRTVAPIVDFCNRVFRTVISRTVVDAASGTDDHGAIAQPDYADLSPWRDAIEGDPGPAVLLVGHAEKESRAETLRVAEATDIASSLAEAKSDGWLVHPKGGDPRPCQWGDMTILLPSRTSLPHLRRALADAGVPYRLETGSLVYATSEVRELLSVLRSIDDPGDEVALLGALRSRAYGCGDDDLLSWRRAGRSWTYLGQGDDDGALDGAVAAAMRDLRARHRARPFQTVPEVVAAVVRERRLFESAMAVAGHRDAWRLYRVVVEHARQFADGESGGLRDFLRWAALQADDKLRSTSPVLPEADVDAVRIMTVHGAKGLEFAITAVSGLSGGFPRSTRGATVRFRPEGGFDVRMKKGLETAQFDARRTIEDVMGEHEGIRLLYVALTRARDHLVVSLHHKAAKTVGCHAHRITEVLDRLAEEADLPAGVERREGSSSHTADHTDDSSRPIEVVRPVGGDVSDADVEAWEEATARWIAARDRLVDRAASGGSLSATALRRMLRPSATDEDDERPEPTTEPWRRGRAGTAIGSAVHAVLQHADLADATGADVASLAAWQAQVEGVVGAASEIETKSRAALASPLVRRAVRGRWWREVHVGAPVASIVDGPVPGTVDLFEGFVDLLFETDAGLVVVDYKTDTVSDDAAVDAALDRYTPQGAAYAVAVEAATGRPVTEVHFLFLRGADAVDAVVPDLDAAKALVRDALRTDGVGS